MKVDKVLNRALSGFAFLAHVFKKCRHYKVERDAGYHAYESLSPCTVMPSFPKNLPHSRWPQAFVIACALFCFSLAQSQETKPRRVALVIGNAAYQQAKLVNPVNDARAMAVRLRTLGFEVVLRENFKTRDIGSVYREFRSRIVPGGVALVFYAGHGLQFKGQNYFPAVDSDINSEEDVPLQSLNLSSLLDNMDEAKAGVSLVLLDACRDNPFARRFRSALRGLAKVEAASGTLIHYATKPGSVASDGDGENGTYTEALLAQMSEPGVPIELMLKRVTNRVVAKTRGKQEPWVEGSLRGDFYFFGPTTMQVQTTPPADDSEAHAWTAALQANSVNAYQAYLDAFPKGRYAVAARISVDAMKPVAAVKVEPVTQRPAVGMPDSSRYSRVGSYLVTDCVKDNSTGLIWEGKTTSGPRASSNAHTNFGDKRNGDVSEYASTVNATRLCGFTDWRLPTKDELTSLVVSGVRPTIDVNWFPNTETNWYWTSSGIGDLIGWDAGSAGVVDFGIGLVGGINRSNTVPARLVRGGQ